MDISLDHYRTFYEIVKAGSFSQAAKQLYVSQSSVSQSLAKLEEALGMTLIERTTKRMRLTDAGALLFEDVRQVMVGLDAAKQKVHRLVRMEEGTIKIGVSDTICRYILMPFLSDFKRRYPAIHLTLSNRPSAISMQAVAQGELDLGVVNLLPPKMAPGASASIHHLQVTTLSQFKEVFIVGIDSGLNEDTPLAQWLDQPFVSLEAGATTRDFVQAVFSHHGYTFNPVIELSSLDLIFDFVEAGFGVGIVPEYALPRHNNVKAIPLPLDVPLREIGIITAAKMPQNIATRQFIKELIAFSKS